MSEFTTADHHPADHDARTDWLAEAPSADPPDVYAPPMAPIPPNPRCTCGHGILLHTLTGLCAYRGCCTTFTPKEGP